MPLQEIPKYNLIDIELEARRLRAEYTRELAISAKNWLKTRILRVVSPAPAKA